MGISALTKNRIAEALDALHAEIEAVLEKPVTETLTDGEYQPRSGTAEAWDYTFKSTNPSLRFVENVRWLDAPQDQGNLAVVTTDAETVTLRFLSDQGERVTSVPIEWENDFVLRKLKEALEHVANGEESGMLEQLWQPSAANTEVGCEAVSPGLNERQTEAVQKALDHPVSFIWGPPGTGKTATLGYVIANFLMYDKRVLFASNTNRAVDVGFLSAVQALEQLGLSETLRRVVRFGDTALDDATLNGYTFEQRLEERVLRNRDKARYLQDMLNELDLLQAEVDDLVRNGYSVPSEVDFRINEIWQRLDAAGGRDFVEERIEKSTIPNELSVLRGMRLVGTTLARVCTSDLLSALRFDAVVIDEASMASLPYVMVLAARANATIVLAGDPMQLPPISITDKPDARAYLEEDIFSRVSGARSSADLFRWHDRNPSITSFFDVQYRMRDDMAGLISDVFYEGRLKSAEERQVSEGKAASVRVLDTSEANPILGKREGGKGFQPINAVHGAIVADEVYRYAREMGIPQRQIGIIVPFRSGVYAYRRWLRERGLDAVEVGTVHTFQGREKQIIFFDTMMSGEVSTNGHLRHYSVRPFDEQKNGLSVPRLLNVALSRARDRLFLIADMRHIRAVYSEKFLGKLLYKAMQIEAEKARPIT